MMRIDCAEFERRLDAGEDPAHDPALLAHANSCAACAAAWAAMAEIDAWLAAPVTAAPAAPAGFTDAVMARIEHPAAAPEPATPEDLPWWIAIFQQPTVALAAVLAAFVIWQGGLLVAAAGAAAGWLVTSGTAVANSVSARLAALPGLPAAPPALLAEHPIVTIGLALGLAPLVALASIALSGWVTRWVTRRVLAA
jgi:hypothetical protein